MMLDERHGTRASFNSDTESLPHLPAHASFFISLSSQRMFCVRLQGAAHGQATAPIVIPSRDFLLSGPNASRSWKILAHPGPMPCSGSLSKAGFARKRGRDEGNLPTRRPRPGSLSSRNPEIPAFDIRSGTLAEVLPDAGAEDPMEVLLRREARARVRRALRRLTRREIRVLSCRYGFGGRRARTLGEIGRELGMTREAVRQIEARARERLSKLLLDEKTTRAAGSKSRGLAVRTATLRPVPSKAERSRSGRDTLSACTGSFEG